MTRALVTGATGMLGSHLVDALIEAGVEVRAYVRPSSNVSRLRELPIELIYANADSAASLRKAAASANWVFHAAGHLTASSPFEVGSTSPLYQKTNVDLTEALVSASLSENVERFVYISSDSVYALDAPIPTPEDAPLHPVSAYGKSKLVSEQIVQHYQRQGLNTTIIRPCVIYGPGDRHFLPTAMRLARLPILPLVDGGHGLFDLVHARDVAEMAILACQKVSAIGRVYNAGPGTPTSLHELISVYRQLTGRGPRIVPVSAHTIERAAGLLRTLLGRLVPQIEPIVSPTGLALMSQDIHLDISRAEAELGFRPRYSLEQGIAATLAELNSLRRSAQV